MLALATGLLIQDGLSVVPKGNPDGRSSFRIATSVIHLSENRHEAEYMEPDTLFVLEFLLARDVIEREPVDVVQSYTMDDGRAWCFARIHNSEEMQDVFFEWYHEDELHFEMNSKVGISENWRTYSSVGLQPGQWHVQLRDRHGEILDEIYFEVFE